MCIVCQGKGIPSYHYQMQHTAQLQQIAIRCNTLHRTTTHCNPLQHTTRLQHSARRSKTLQHTTRLHHSAWHSKTLQHTTRLHHSARHSKTLQHTHTHTHYYDYTTRHVLIVVRTTIKGPLTFISHKCAKNEMTCNRYQCVHVRGGTGFGV